MAQREEGCDGWRDKWHIWQNLVQVLKMAATLRGTRSISLPRP